MAIVTYNVTIKNGSNDTSTKRRYFAYFAAPAITGNTGRAALPVVSYKTNSLGNGARASFSYTSEIFGYIGRSSSSSSNLKAGDNVTLEDAKPATVSERGNGGKVLQVKLSDDDGQPTIAKNPDDADNAPQRTFTVYCDAGITYPNSYVTGLARNVVNSGETATAALPAISGHTYNIKPNPILYIVQGDDNQGSIVSTTATADNSFSLDFGAGRTSAVVTNTTNADGKSIFSAVFS
ncbi:hypothetical protein DTO166G4_288 [Paecilomyces variotii]|nr:hypothetical protein DTO166G4_288 [Paecilomyces variotii]KAJ9241109.1 hypothetical protein DTO166G5_1271 [Paecilomyces variotii]KAJ9307071.1 hypothetical protein DTO217A2_3491 [Paecilomyces variotii]